MNILFQQRKLSASINRDTKLSQLSRKAYDHKISYSSPQRNLPGSTAEGVKSLKFANYFILSSDSVSNCPNNQRQTPHKINLSINTFHAEPIGMEAGCFRYKNKSSKLPLRMTGGTPTTPLIYHQYYKPPPHCNINVILLSPSLVYNNKYKEEQ